MSRQHNGLHLVLNTSASTKRQGNYYITSHKTIINLYTTPCFLAARTNSHQSINSCNNPLYLLFKSYSTPLTYTIPSFAYRLKLGIESQRSQMTEPPAITRPSVNRSER